MHPPSGLLERKCRWLPALITCILADGFYLPRQMLLQPSRPITDPSTHQHGTIWVLQRTTSALSGHYLGSPWASQGTSWTMHDGLLMDYFWTTCWSHWEHSELCEYYWRSVPLPCGQHMAIFSDSLSFFHPVWNVVSLTFLWQGLMRGIWRDKSAIWHQLP